MSKSALQGIRVLDLTRMLAGPYCTALLADIGAEVIKIELPQGGDDARHIAPYKGGEGGYFMILNRGKKSLTLNLKSVKGRAILLDLVRQSDVLVENFTPGVAERLGLGYAALRAINPRLVYASISGFGQTGPLAHRPAYDIIAQAMGGLMSLTGTPDGPPTRVGESIADVVAGLYCSWGILAALAARQTTGEGQHVDVAMLDSIFSLLVTAMTQLLYGERPPGRVGNRHPMTTPFDSFRAADGHVVIAVANNGMFERFAAAIGRPELARDPRFVTDDERTRHEPLLKAMIEGWTGTRSVDAVVAALEAAGVPASPIWSVETMAGSAHVRHRELLTELTHPSAGTITVLQEPVQFSGTPRHVQGPAPRLGEQTDLVLQSLLGLDAAAIAALRAEGVV